MTTPIARSRPRARVLLKAKARGDGWQSEVRVRDLTPDGALLEGASAPAVGEAVVLVHRDRAAEARVSWVEGRRFGVHFNQRLSREALFVPVD